MGKKAFINQKGQTVVEYILLLSVVASLVYTFYKSNYFRTYFGPEGTMATSIVNSMQFGYRHAYLRGRPEAPEPEQYQGATHPSYVSPQGGSRFFGPRDPYQ